MLDIFYFASIRKMVAAFGTLFNNIYIERRSETGADGDVVQRIKVPFAYGPRMKHMAILDQKETRRRGGIGYNVKTQLPRISYELKNIEYNSKRKLNSTNRHTIVSDSDRYSVPMQLQSVPYDFIMPLYIETKNMDDNLQIIEQILPYFTPEFSLTIEEIPELSIKKDVSFIIGSVSIEDNWDGSFDEYRYITTTISFTAQGSLYPPIKDQKIIKRIFTNIHASSDIDSMIAVQVKDEVSPFNAKRDDDWTVERTITEFEGSDSNAE